MSAPRLRLSALERIPAEIDRPAYAPARLGIGIVHLGIGAFHRAHQAIYTDDAIARAGGAWGICGVSLRSADVRDRMLPQDCLYTAIEKSPARVRRRIVGSVREVLFLGDQRDDVHRRLAAPETRIVTLTVTEKGYCHEPATGKLDFAHPDIVHDLRAARGAAQCRGPADLGARTASQHPRRAADRRLLRQPPAQRRAAARTWSTRTRARAIRRSPNGSRAASRSRRRWSIASSRRRPPTTLRRTTLRSGCEDLAPVVHEPFIQWVIEDCFRHRAAGVGAGGRDVRP